MIAHAIQKKFLKYHLADNTSFFPLTTYNKMSVKPSLKRWNSNQFGSYAQMVQYSHDSIPFFSLVYSSVAWNRKFSCAHSNHDWLRTSVISKGKDLSNRYLHGPGLHIRGGYGQHLTLSKWRYNCAASLFRFSACMLSFDFILGWNFVFCCFKFIILHYFSPQSKGKHNSNQVYIWTATCSKATGERLKLEKFTSVKNVTKLI